MNETACACPGLCDSQARLSQLFPPLAPHLLPGLKAREDESSPAGGPSLISHLFKGVCRHPRARTQSAATGLCRSQKQALIKRKERDPGGSPRARTGECVLPEGGCEGLGICFHHGAQERERNQRQGGGKRLWVCGWLQRSWGLDPVTSPPYHLSFCPGAWFRALGPCPHGSPALPGCRVLGSHAHFVMETHRQGGRHSWIPRTLCVCRQGVGNIWVYR